MAGRKARRGRISCLMLSNRLDPCRRTRCAQYRFLPVSVGVHDFPTEFGAKIAVRTVVEFVLKNPGVFGKIGWIVKNEQELEICRAQIERYDLDRLTETVDF